MRGPLLIVAAAIALVGCGAPDRAFDPLRQGQFECPQGSRLEERRNGDGETIERRCIRSRGVESALSNYTYGKACKWADNTQFIECSCYIGDQWGVRLPQWTTKDPSEAMRRDCPEGQGPRFEINVTPQ